MTMTRVTLRVRLTLEQAVVAAVSAVTHAHCLFDTMLIRLDLTLAVTGADSSLDHTEALVFTPFTEETILAGTGSLASCDHARSVVGADKPFGILGALEFTCLASA
jgi:hypothetical protein